MTERAAFAEWCTFCDRCIVAPDTIYDDKTLAIRYRLMTGEHIDRDEVARLRDCEWPKGREVGKRIRL